MGLAFLFSYRGVAERMQDRDGTPTNPQVVRTFGGAFGAFGLIAMSFALVWFAQGGY